ncbi:SDR family oxidoreductase [Streptomyces tauricus]|uniref:SDR family oxidoreductase n=1 Tax=Streptomyces tauricus TaxID=68274 RepID=UPI00381E029E
MFDFTGKTVLITGATGALGTTLSTRFSAAGANTVAAARTGADRLAAQLDGPSLGVRLDVTSESDRTEAVQRTEERFGPLDILINNAAYLRVGTVESIPLDEFHRVFDTDVTGALLGIRAAAPADFILFAASDRARFATGSELVADGGFTLGPLS